jgi:Domain of unknown function (DUF1937).
MIYLAAPYSALSRDTETFRYHRTLNITAHLTEKGQLVYSPIVHCHPIAAYIRHCRREPPAHDFWMRHCLQILSLCDQLYVVTFSGWRKSRGVQLEVAKAQEWEIEVLHYSPQKLLTVKPRGIH